MAGLMKSIALLSAACGLFLPAATAQDVRQLNAVSSLDSVATAHAPEGSVKMDLREIQVNETGTEGLRHLKLSVMFEPTSGAFSWRVQVADEPANTSSAKIQNPNDEHAAFFRNGEIVDFWALMFRLYIRDCRGRASSMDDAETKALAAASKSINSQEDLLGNGRDTLVVSFAAISNDFLYPPMNATPSVTAPKITDVQWDGEHWIVTLQARWTEAITLDADYNVVSMRRTK